jgi:hypothetical protein
MTNDAKLNKDAVWLSKCHDAPCIVRGADEGTNYYECSVCHKPCDFYAKDAASEDRCTLYLDHRPLWVGDRFACDRCGMRFVGVEDTLDAPHYPEYFPPKWKKDTKVKKLGDKLPFTLTPANGHPTQPNELERILIDLYAQGLEHGELQTAIAVPQKQREQAVVIALNEVKTWSKEQARKAFRDGQEDCRKGGDPSNHVHFKEASRKAELEGYQAAIRDALKALPVIAAERTSEFSDGERSAIKSALKSIENLK